MKAIEFNDGNFPKFFMCANSAGGFTERFSCAYSPEDGWHTYIIKGGPGTGKSTAMKKIAQRLFERGENVHLIPCTADADSLDAVVLPDKRLMIADGTAPHVIEPRYVGCCEHLTDFGESFNVSVLSERRAEIIALCKKISRLYQSVYGYLAAAGEIILINEGVNTEALSLKKTEALAGELIARYIPRGKPGVSQGKASERFLSGVVSGGVQFYSDTPRSMGLKVVAVYDKYRVCAPKVIKALQNYALKNGYDAIVCKNPLFPDKAEHLLIPALSLAFMSVYDGYNEPGGVIQKIYTDYCMSMRAAEKTESAKENDKAAKKLIKNASRQMEKAKELHDRLELCYKSGVNFKKVDAATERLYKNVLKRLREI